MSPRELADGVAFALVLILLVVILLIAAMAIVVMWPKTRREKMLDRDREYWERRAKARARPSLTVVGPPPDYVTAEAGLICRSCRAPLYAAQGETRDVLAAVREVAGQNPTMLCDPCYRTLMGDARRLTPITRGHAMTTRPPTIYEIKKLARMAQENRAELEALKAAQAAGQWADRRRAIKLQRSIKAQARLERDLQRRAGKALTVGGEQ